MIYTIEKRNNSSLSLAQKKITAFSKGILLNLAPAIINLVLLAASC